MISSVRGNVLQVGLDRVVLDVGGVGLLVHTTPAVAAAHRAGSSALVHTCLVVREDSLTLYGFDDDEARRVFETMQTVSGVGPRLALAMLAVHPPDVLRAAVARGEVKTLTRVPGIGPKVAQRICLELRDRMGALGEGAAGVAPPTGAGADLRGPVREALLGLGWSAKQADEALDAVTPQAGPGATVSELLRAALRTLARS
ncbi:MAG: Holliday junction branch migration protein RuvA [Dermatophilaceae bacterium]